MHAQCHATRGTTSTRARTAVAVRRWAEKEEKRVASTETYGFLSQTACRPDVLEEGRIRGMSRGGGRPQSDVGTPAAGHKEEERKRPHQKERKKRRRGKPIFRSADLLLLRRRCSTHAPAGPTLFPTAPHKQRSRPRERGPPCKAAFPSPPLRTRPLRVPRAGVLSHPEHRQLELVQCGKSTEGRSWWRTVGEGRGVSSPRLKYLTPHTVRFNPPPPHPLRPLTRRNVCVLPSFISLRVSASRHQAHLLLPQPQKARTRTT